MPCIPEINIEKSHILSNFFFYLLVRLL
uniref:Uncharacterized protein n=1 Tax=Rhizophora mucronata TaxID=61149 RepID=A0A2P2NLV0_RHIMU